MKASISFLEIQKLLTDNIKQTISLAFVNSKTMKVGYPLDLGFIKKDITANLIIKKLDGTDLLLQLDAGFGSDTMATTIINLIKGKAPDGLIEKHPDSHLLVHLGLIEQLKVVLDKIAVNDLHVLVDGLEVEGQLK